MAENITVATSEGKQVVDVTDEVNRQVTLQAGLIHLFVTHTTAALACADLDPGTDLDMLDAFYGMMPDIKFRHPHDPRHAPDHILASLIGPEVTLPAQNGRLILGTWQRVVLFEFDGPRRRRVVVSVV